MRTSRNGRAENCRLVRTTLKPRFDAALLALLLLAVYAPTMTAKIVKTAAARTIRFLTTVMGVP
jgi:hypothetical protein